MRRSTFVVAVIMGWVLVSGGFFQSVAKGKPGGGGDARWCVSLYDLDDGEPLSDLITVDVNRENDRELRFSNRTDDLGPQTDFAIRFPNLPPPQTFDAMGESGNCVTEFDGSRGTFSTEAQAGLNAIITDLQTNEHMSELDFAAGMDKVDGDGRLEFHYPVSFEDPNDWIQRVVVKWVFIAENPGFVTDNNALLTMTNGYYVFWINGAGISRELRHVFHCSPEPEDSDMTLKFEQCQ